MSWSNLVYRAVIKHTEGELERTGAYCGNGHHLAQRLAQMVEDTATERGYLLVGPQAKSDEDVVAEIKAHTSPLATLFDAGGAFNQTRFDEILLDAEERMEKAIEVYDSQQEAEEALGA